MMQPAATQLTVRPATPADLGDALDIYRGEVLHGTATYEVEPPTLDDFALRHAAVRSAGLPWLVAVDAGATSELLGYAYASPFRTRAAYRWTVENSIYVATSARGRGVGRALLAALIDEATALGYRQMVAVVGDAGNSGSIQLHRAAGFSTVGQYPGIAYKHGRWLTSVHMIRPLGAGSTTAPSEPLRGG